MGHNFGMLHDFDETHGGSGDYSTSKPESEEVCESVQCSCYVGGYSYSGKKTQKQFQTG